MSGGARKPGGSGPAGPRPLWLRLIPFYTLALLFAWLLLFRPVFAWFEGDLGLGFLGAALAIGLPFLALVGIPFLFALMHEHRRNRM
jgi:hypothetical protein